MGSKGSLLWIALAAAVFVGGTPADAWAQG